MLGLEAVYAVVDSALLQGQGALFGVARSTGSRIVCHDREWRTGRREGEWVFRAPRAGRGPRGGRDKRGGSAQPSRGGRFDGIW